MFALGMLLAVNLGVGSIMCSSYISQVYIICLLCLKTYCITVGIGARTALLIVLLCIKQYANWGDKIKPN